MLGLLPQKQADGWAARWRLRIVYFVRAIPIRWRILAIAGLNSAVVLVLAAMIWSGGKVLESAWEDVRQVRQSDRLLAELEGETSRLQSLIHRYINQPTPEQFAEILLLREAVLGILTTRAATDPMLAGSVDGLERVTERFLDGFGELRAVQATIEKTYDEQVLRPAKDMAGLYAIIEGAAGRHDGLIWPALGKSREAFTAMLVAANAYYLSLATSSAEDARKNTDIIERTIPVLSDLAENDVQRIALARLKDKTRSLRDGLTSLSEEFTKRTTLLRDGIDASQAEAMTVINALSVKMRDRENQAQGTFDHTLKRLSERVLWIAGFLIVVIVITSIVIAISIRLPLRQLMTAMRAIMAGDFDRKVRGIRATDEIGAMARAVEIFRENAIARRQAEQDLRASKERAEHALLDLRTAQQNLIDAERLAALGRLVAGVAHEVNNPIGISLTVASSFSRHAGQFEDELKAGRPLRKSQLEEFLRICRDAGQQLVANLHRAGDLVQSFKQVAVDRSQAEVRQFDLSEATDQIVASLRPVLKKAPVIVDIDIPPDLVLSTYAGAYGQILTNLFLNAVSHAFPGERPGRIFISARPHGDHIEIVFSDDGVGMTAEVRKQAFDPFFTTRRGEGGTGLGLHIIYNLVTQQLGGSMTLESGPGQGAAFRIIIPRAMTRAGSATFPPSRETRQWPTTTMSSI